MAKRGGVEWGKFKEKEGSMKESEGKRRRGRAGKGMRVRRKRGLSDREENKEIGRKKGSWPKERRREGKRRDEMRMRKKGEWKE